MTQTLERQPGGLYVQTPSQEQIAFPLKHTEVQAKVAGNISRVEVTQSFENPFTTTLDAVYIFPLPDEAAVDDMLIRIGDRTIQGSIKKRQEAQQIYEQAKQQGRTAGLLEQERDNIFTQSLANIKPGEQIDVIIRYTESLKFDGGNYEFVFPMVVGPRYIPGITIEEDTASYGSADAPMMQNQDTDLVPDASRLNAPILPMGTRSRHDINVTVEIDAGVEIQDIQSPSHQIQITHAGQRVQVKLVGADTIPNKDLILRYQVGGDRNGKLHITGIAAGGTRYQHTFDLNFENTGNPAIAQLWGRSRIKDLMNQMVSGETKLGVEAVTDTALTYQLLSQYTAFVAVSDDVRVDSTQGSVSVQVPVEMPEGISHQGIFGGAVYAAPPAGARVRQRRLAQPPQALMSPPSPAQAMPPSEEIESLSIQRKSPYIGDAYPPAFDVGSGLSDLDQYNLELLNPSVIESDQIDAELARMSPIQRLQVVSVTGLDQQMIYLLTQYLQSIQLPTGCSGNLVFEFQINKGRVRQVVLDKQASACQQHTVIEIIRRSLLTWRSPQTLTSTVILTIQIQP